VAAVTSPRSRTTPLPYLPSAPMPRRVLEAGWPPLWWVGCHGGAGVTTLARMTDIGAEMGAAWPQVPPDWRIQSVVLVARASAAGIRAAEGAVEQWRTRRVPNVRVLGLVVVGASPKRPPKIVTERLQLLGGWMPSIWRVGWVETFLAADDPMDVGVPPDVQAVRHGLDGILNEGAQ
jgi:hypothetical protein